MRALFSKLSGLKKEHQKKLKGAAPLSSDAKAAAQAALVSAAWACAIDVCYGLCSAATGVADTWLRRSGIPVDDGAVNPAFEARRSRQDGGPSAEPGAFPNQHAASIGNNFLTAELFPNSAGTLVGVLSTLVALLDEERLGVPIQEGRFVVIGCDIGMSNIMYRLVHTSTPWQASTTLAEEVSARICADDASAERDELKRLLNDYMNLEQNRDPEKEPFNLVLNQLLDADEEEDEGHTGGGRSNAWRGKVTVSRLLQVRKALRDRVIINLDTFHPDMKFCGAINAQFRSFFFKPFFAAVFTKGNAHPKLRFQTLAVVFTIVSNAVDDDVEGELNDWRDAIVRSGTAMDPRCQALSHLLRTLLPMARAFSAARRDVRDVTLPLTSTAATPASNLETLAPFVSICFHSLGRLAYAKATAQWAVNTRRWRRERHPLYRALADEPSQLESEALEIAHGMLAAAMRSTTTGKTGFEVKNNEWRSLSELQRVSRVAASELPYLTPTQARRVYGGRYKLKEGSMLMKRAKKFILEFIAACRAARFTATSTPAIREAHFVCAHSGVITATMLGPVWSDAPGISDGLLAALVAQFEKPITADGWNETADDEDAGAGAGVEGDAGVSLEPVEDETDAVQKELGEHVDAI